MPTPAWSLQQAIFSRLATDAGLLALLGGPRVYDDVPQGAQFPYLSFGQTTARDWSTGSEDGAEIIATLHVWSHARGRKQAQAIIGAIRSALHDQPLALAGHRLVNLRQEFSETRRDADGEAYHGLVRYRAITEPV